MHKPTIPTCCLALALLAGCSTTPHYDKRFGDSVRQARAAMTINPDAAAKAPPATGMDGPAAEKAITRYHDSFKEPPPVTNVINIGSSAGAGR